MACCGRRQLSKPYVVIQSFSIYECRAIKSDTWGLNGVCIGERAYEVNAAICQLRNIYIQCTEFRYSLVLQNPYYWSWPILLGVLSVKEDLLILNWFLSHFSWWVYSCSCRVVDQLSFYRICTHPQEHIHLVVWTEGMASLCQYSIDSTTLKYDWVTLIERTRT